MKDRLIKHSLIYTALCILFCTLCRADSKLADAIRSNDLAQVESILSGTEEFNINENISCGATPLHLAAALNSPRIALLLIDKGADINAVSTQGFTPLHWAAGADASAVADVLLRSGSEINSKAELGITPLHWAASKNATNSVMLLLQRGADVQIKTKTGLTPLHSAIKSGAADAAMLIAYAAVSDDMADENVQQSPIKVKIHSDPNNSKVVNLPPPKPFKGKKPQHGKSLIVDLGYGEELEFVWCEKMNIWVGTYEITNGQFRRFRASHNSYYRENFNLNKTDQPAVYVSWIDATVYIAWLNKYYSDRIPRNCRFRLPTDMEWRTFAGCGDGRKYPWGNTFPPKYGNFSDLTAREKLTHWSGITGYDDGFPVSCPVKESGENEWGIHGLAGNVWEWCEDWYDSDRKFKVRHGGSWDFDTEPMMRVQTRGFDKPESKYDTIGFRVVISMSGKPMEVKDLPRRKVRH